VNAHAALQVPLAEAAPDELLEVVRVSAATLRVLLEDRQGGGLEVPETAMTGHHLVEHRPEAEDVRPRVDRFGPPACSGDM